MDAIVERKQIRTVCPMGYGHDCGLLAHVEKTPELQALLAEAREIDQVLARAKEQCR